MNKQLQSIINETKERIDWDDYFISTALLISCRSSCNRLHVGCILVKNNRIISSGYNGFLPGSAHVSIIKVDGENSNEQATVHAECNAIADCANRGVNISNAIAYITHYPCINCFKMLVASGIREIKYLHDYKNDKNIEILLNNMDKKTVINKIY